MIAFLEGRIETLDDSGVVLLCGGVGIGFRLLCSAHTRARMTEGEETRLFVVLQARDGDLKLYGFFEPAERDAFQLLLSVQGIGGKLALTVLSHLERTALARAITAHDKASLQAVPGLGARTAQRLITELEGKMGALHDALAASADTRLANALQPSDDERLWLDLADALESLGFERAETGRALQALRREEKPESLNEALRKALKMLRPSRRTERDETATSRTQARR